MIVGSFSEIIEGEVSLYRWIGENSIDGVLSSDKQNKLPDIESKSLSMPELDDIDILAGMVDSIMGSGAEDADSLAGKLFLIMKSFLDDDGVSVDVKIGKVYGFLIEHNTMSYIDNFIDLVGNEQSNEKFLFTCHEVASIFASESAHREAVKFGIAILGLFKLISEDIEILLVLGLADEFSKFVSIAFLRCGLNDNIFMLAKATQGWGRVNYIKALEADSDEIRKWLIYEGYRCDIGTSHVAYDCASKGDLLGEIKDNGWSEELFDITAELINGLISFESMHNIEFYNDFKNVVELFLEESCHIDMNLDRFYYLINLFYYLSDYYVDAGWSEQDKDILVDKISKSAYSRGIDWKSIIYKDVTDYRARAVAKAINIDIWDKLYELALSDDKFDSWYGLTEGADIDRYRKICILAEKKLPLMDIATGAKDELGLGREFDAHMNLTMIIQRLDEFDEIMGLELIKTALNSPVTNNRNMALRVIGSWAEIPDDVVEILRNNRDIEPNSDTADRYDIVLSRLDNNTLY